MDKRTFSPASSDAPMAAGPDNTSFVQDIFSRVSARYDLMNDAMSLGLHRLWKKKFIQQLALFPEMHILDVAAGTGDITREIIKRTQHTNFTVHISATDLNENMLQEGKKRLIDAGILQNVHWQVADAQALPYPDNSFNAYVIAFGLRNVSQRSKALSEALRVLKPGGQFLCMEFSHVTPAVLKHLYKGYSTLIIPRLGHLIAGDKAAYEYLVESIRAFPSQTKLQQQLEEIGFMKVSYQNLTCGVVAIHMGWKQGS